MTIAAYAKDTYTGTGATATYPFTFPIFAASDLALTVVDSVGAVTHPVLNVDYTVSAVPAVSGTITLTLNLPLNSVLTVERVRPLTQTTDIRNQGNYFPDVIEDTFDNVTMLSQQIQDEVDRTLKIASTDTAADLTLPTLATRKGQLLGFDATTGNPAAVLPSNSPVSSAMQPVVAASTVAAALALLGGVGLAYAAKTSNYTTLDTDVILTAATAGGAFQITLKTAGKTGKFLLIKKTDANTNALTISDGTLTLTLMMLNEFVCVYDTGTTWQILFSNSVASVMESRNVGLAASVGSNAMTLALKTRTGVDATANDPIFIPFRNATLTTGTYVQRAVSAALSTVISSGSTGGTASGQPSYVWVYAIDNAGSVELAWSTNRIWDESLLYTTTAEGGAGAADDGFTLYSTTARTNVAVKLLGFVLSTQSTAGTWASAPSNICCVGPSYKSARHEVLATNATGYGSSNTKIRTFGAATINVGTAIGYVQSGTAGDSFIIKEAGLFFLSASDINNAGSIFYGITVNSTNLSTSIDSISQPSNVAMTFQASSAYGMCCDLKRLVVGDIVRHHAGAANGITGSATTFHIIKICD